MAIIGKYEMRVEGILNGRWEQNQNRIARFKTAITLDADAPYPGQGDPGLPEDASPAPFPAGFILKDWKAYIWHVEGRPNAHDSTKTNLYFHVEVAGVLDGTLHEPAIQARARLEFDWFLTHDKRGWCKDLMQKLMALNDQFEKEGVLVENLRMRKFHWYLGNGGC
jgi:hypothetical protein